MSTGRSSTAENFDGFQNAVYALERQIGEERRAVPVDSQGLLAVGHRIGQKLRHVAHLGAMLLPVRAELEPNERGRRLGLLLSDSAADPMYLSELSPAYVCPSTFIFATERQPVSSSFALPVEGSVVRLNCSYYELSPEPQEDARFVGANFSIAKYAIDPTVDRIEDAPKKGEEADPLLVGQSLVGYHDEDDRYLIVKGEFIKDTSDIRTAHRELLRATQLVQYGFMAVGS